MRKSRKIGYTVSDITRNKHPEEYFKNCAYVMCLFSYALSKITILQKEILILFTCIDN